MPHSFDRFNGSTVRFTDLGTQLDRDPGDESLGYFQIVRFADCVLLRPDPYVIFASFKPFRISPDASGFGTYHRGVD